jgi:hypothetical protein
MPDYAHRKTEAQLHDLEDRLYSLYSDAEKSMRMKAASYFAQFEKRDRDMREAVRDGKVTEAYYQTWRKVQIARGEQFVYRAEDFAAQMLTVNQRAADWCNKDLPQIYALNYNHTVYQIEQLNGMVALNLTDENTVKRMLMKNPDLLPNVSVDAEKDALWNKKAFEKEILAGIVEGDDISHLADRIQHLVDGNRKNAVRVARTAYTSAQNGGRQQSYEAAADIGIDVHKRWIATKDGHTREAHGIADGQVVRYDRPFKVGGYDMMFPGDPTAPGALVWNCRCTTCTVEKDGIEAGKRKMRVIDPVTHKNVLVDEMTYTEWLTWKKRREEDGEEHPV